MVPIISTMTAVVLLNTDLNGLFILESKSLTGQATAAHSIKDYTFDIAKTGYTFYGVVRFAINSGGQIATVGISQSDNQATYKTINTGDSTATPSLITITCLYKKN